LDLGMTKAAFCVALAIIGYLLWTPLQRPLPAFAQSTDRVSEGLQIWQTSGCAECHGPFADGEREDDDYPMGANLRATRLGLDGLKLAIRCGRPGVGMPAFDEQAYTRRECYGRPLGAPPDDLQPSPSALTHKQIDTLIAYLQARIVGRGRVIKEECLVYYDGRADQCEDVQ